MPDNLSPIQVDFALGGSFSSGNQRCSGIVCHEPRVWGSSCADCHNSPPNTGAHQVHLAVDQISCPACQQGNQHDEDKNSGFIEIGGVGYNFILYDQFTGDYTSACHQKKQWDCFSCHGYPRWDCTSCHGYPPKSGNHNLNIHRLGCEQSRYAI